MKLGYIDLSSIYNNCQMNELIFQAGVKGMSERSELIPCMMYTFIAKAIIWYGALQFVGDLGKGVIPLPLQK